jgi:hypothetical protein
MAVAYLVHARGTKPFHHRFPHLSRLQANQEKRVRIAWCVVDGAQDRRPVNGYPCHLLVVIKHTHDVVLAAASHHRQNFTGQAAGGNQDQLTHLPLPAPALCIVLLIRLILTVSSTWNTGRMSVLSVSRSVCCSRALPVSRQR